MIDVTTRRTLYDFMRARWQAVIATADEDGKPEAALVNIAVTPKLEVVFETTSATRKFINLRLNPKVSFVIGWGGDETLQYDGVVEKPEGPLLEQIRDHYLSVFPNKLSDQNWPGNHYFLVRPVWIRLSNYYPPRRIEEYDFPAEDAPAKHDRWEGFFGASRRP